jgi:hypothetical protein
MEKEMKELLEGLLELFVVVMGGASPIILIVAVWEILCVPFKVAPHTFHPFEWKGSTICIFAGSAIILLAIILFFQIANQPHPLEELSSKDRVTIMLKSFWIVSALGWIGVFCLGKGKELSQVEHRNR